MQIGVCVCVRVCVLQSPVPTHGVGGASLNRRLQSGSGAALTHKDGERRVAKAQQVIRTHTYAHTSDVQQQSNYTDRHALLE